MKMNAMIILEKLRAHSACPLELNNVVVQLHIAHKTTFKMDETNAGPTSEVQNS